MGFDESKKSKEFANASEQQIGGDHYKKYAIQPMEFSYRNEVPSMESAVIKYVLRHRDKNGKQDLQKAIHILEMLIEWEYDSE